MRFTRVGTFCTVALLILAGRLAIRPTLSPSPQTYAAEATPAPVDPRPAPARPVALAWSRPGRELLVANRDAASLAALDAESLRPTAEWPVGSPASALAVVSENLWLTTHAAENELRVWQRSGETLTLAATQPTPAGPVAVAVLDGGRRCAVSSLWGRKVSLFDVASEAGGVRLQCVWETALPYAPRLILELAEEGRLIIGDAYTGQLGVVVRDTGVLERVVTIPGVNLRGLARMPGQPQLVVTHQILNQLAETSRDGVFWGIVFSNNLRVIPLANLLEEGRAPLQDANVHFLGDPKAGAGDPTALVVLPDQTMVVSLGGVDEIASGLHLDHSFDRTPTGRRPVALLADPERGRVFAANQFSDVIDVFDVDRRKITAQIALRPESRSPTPAERGEALFYDAKLSLDGWYSCHSCHTDGHTVGLLNDNLGDGNYGAPKRIPSLLGTAETGPWTWSGGHATLAEQIQKSITSTMQGEEPTAEQVADLIAYLKELPAPPRLGAAEPERVARGGRLFDELACAACHRPPTFTTPATYDVGLQDQHGRTKFNPPSLRGVRFRGPFLHDNRAASLAQLFGELKHRLPRDLDDAELADLIAFLESL